MSDIEKRCYVGEVRAAEVEGEPTKIIGYASVFNSRSELIFGSFREVIKPGAFDDVLGDDVRALFNHDPNFILGRSSAGTLPVLPKVPPTLPRRRPTVRGFLACAKLLSRKTKHG